MIDLDPRKEKMNIFDIGASATFLADSGSALSQINRYISESPRFLSMKETYDERWKSLTQLMRLQGSCYPTWTEDP